MHTQIKSSGPLGAPKEISHTGSDSTNHNTAVLLCGWDVVRNIYLLIGVESIMWFELLLLSFCSLFLNLTLLTTLTTVSPLTWCCIKSRQNCQNLKWHCTLFSDPTALDTCAEQHQFIGEVFFFLQKLCKNWGHQWLLSRKCLWICHIHKCLNFVF